MDQSDDAGLDNSNVAALNENNQHPVEEARYSGKEPRGKSANKGTTVPVSDSGIFSQEQSCSAQSGSAQSCSSSGSNAHAQPATSDRVRKKLALVTKEDDEKENSGENKGSDEDEDSLSSREEEPGPVKRTSSCERSSPVSYGSPDVLENSRLQSTINLEDRNLELSLSEDTQVKSTEMETALETAIFPESLSCTVKVLDHRVGNLLENFKIRPPNGNQVGSLFTWPLRNTLWCFVLIEDFPDVNNGVQNMQENLQQFHDLGAIRNLELPLREDGGGVIDVVPELQDSLEFTHIHHSSGQLIN